jgi:hypothetical protein
MVLAQSGVQPGVALGGVLTAVAGVAMLWLARRHVRRLAATVRVDERPVGEVTPGTVAVSGEVVPAGETVTGRVDETEAVVTEYREHSSSKGGQGSGGSTSRPLALRLTPDVLTRTAAVPFYVDDGSGRVLVDAMHADLSLAADSREREVESGKRTTELEARLEPGDEVSVVGRAVPADRYDLPSRGLLGTVVDLVSGSVEQSPASAVLDDEELVVTRDGEGTFVVSDVGGWRGRARHALAALFWALFALGMIAFGGYLVADALGVGLPV